MRRLVVLLSAAFLAVPAASLGHPPFEKLVGASTHRAAAGPDLLHPCDHWCVTRVHLTAHSTRRLETARFGRDEVAIVQGWEAGHRLGGEIKIPLGLFYEDRGLLLRVAGQAERAPLTIKVANFTDRARDITIRVRSSQPDERLSVG